MRHSTAVTFLLLPQGPAFDSLRSPKFISMLLRFINGAVWRYLNRGIKMLILKAGLRSMSLISYHLRVIECLTQLLKPAIVGDNVEFIIRTPQNSISLVCPFPFLPSKPLGVSAFFERERERDHFSASIFFRHERKKTLFRKLFPDSFPDKKNLLDPVFGETCLLRN